jgi:hypothetical protein
MTPHRSLALPCRQCGKQVSFLQREANRNANYIVACPHCGFIDLAMNIVGKAVHDRMNKLGRPGSKPFVPEPIDPVQVLPGEDGFEFVIRRPKKGGASIL